MSERTRFVSGLVIAAIGVAVLGADQISVSADSSTFLGNRTSIFTLIGVAILFIAFVWFVAFRPKRKEQ